MAVVDQNVTHKFAFVMTSDVDDAQERKHVLCVCHSLMVYHLYAKREISRQVHYFLLQFLFSSANN